MKNWARFVYPLVAVSVLLNFFFYRQLDEIKDTQGKYKVLEVLDGDSIIIKLDQRIRLANLDAPELEFCYGKEAKKNVEELVLGEYVEIEEVGRDKFGRTLGMVYLNGQLVNEVIARNGWAKYDSRGGTVNKEIAELIKKAAQEAKEKSLGVWSLKCYQMANLENPDCLIKGNISKRDQVKIYHLPGCSKYEQAVVELDLGEEWFCTEKEAQEAGYRKSEHCFD